MLIAVTSTWTVNSPTVRLPQVLDRLQANPVDVHRLQKAKLADDTSPHADLAGAADPPQWFGQNIYNGGILAISLVEKTEVFAWTIFWSARRSKPRSQPVRSKNYRERMKHQATTHR